MTDAQVIALVKLLYAHLGKTLDDEWQRVRLEVIKESNRYCGICGKITKRKERTVDHIIPKNIIYEYELLGLIFDKRNLRVAHAQCNQGRGTLTIDDLPAKVKHKLLALRKSK